VKAIVADASWLDSFVQANGTADAIKREFARHEHIRDGQIEEEDLKSVLRSLNLNLTDAEFEALCPEKSSADKLNIDEFIDSLLIA